MTKVNKITYNETELNLIELHCGKHLCPYQEATDELKAIRLVENDF